MNYIRNIWMLLFLLASTVSFSQQEEVKVVKPYTPTLSGAEKIQLLPQISDSVNYERPEFEYTIFSKRYDPDYRVTPINPARMVKPDLDKLYKSELKLGGGNYLTPLAELRINQVRSSSGTFGVLLKHHSMNGRIRLENKEKVDAGFSENKIDVYGKRFGKNQIFEYNTGVDYNSYVHYGVDTLYSDTVSREKMTHQFFNAYAGLGLQTARPDSFHLNYSGTLDYNFFTHAFDQMEHGIVLDANVSQIYNDFRIGGEIGLSFHGHQESWDTLLTNQLIIKLNPYISKSGNDWKFRVGFNTYTELRNGEVIPHFYVKGKFSFNIVEDVLVPYLGVDGYQEAHSYRDISIENPYIIPGLIVLPASNRIIAYAGLKGKITNYLAWNIRGTYRSVNDQYFFATDTSNILNNQFTVLYDDMTVMNVYAELNIAPMEALNVFFKANYYNYQMVREEEAWYKANFDASIQARYSLGNKILADAGIFAIGPRYYPALNATDEAGKLNTSIDLNLGLEYRYTKLLSFWAKFNNITAQPYYLWHNYPSYRFRIMLGFTYGL